MLYAERGVGLAGAVHRTWAVAEKNDWQFSNPRIDTVCRLTPIHQLSLTPLLVLFYFWASSVNTWKGHKTDLLIISELTHFLGTAELNIVIVIIMHDHDHRRKSAMVLDYRLHWLEAFKRPNYKYLQSLM